MFSFSAVAADRNHESGVDVLTGLGRPRFPGKMTLLVGRLDRSVAAVTDLLVSNVAMGL